MKIIQLAIRTLCRFKMYTVINIMGLALSLSCAIFIFHYVHHEMTVDTYTSNKNRIGFTVRYDKSQPSAPAVIGSPFSDADVELLSDFTWYNKDMVTVGKEVFDVEVIVADSNFLKVMDFPVLYGHTDLLAHHPQNVIVSESFARKLFGKENPIGKKVVYSTGDPLTITAVISDQGPKRSMHFDLIVSDLLQEDWVNSFPMTVILIREGADFSVINKRHNAYEKSPQSMMESRYQLLPIAEAYFNTTVRTYNKMLLTGNMSYVKQLSLVGILILLVGMFNFISIYTIIILKRGREFGLKKIFGNNPSRLFVQLYVENLFLTAISIFVCRFFLELFAGPISSLFDIAQQKNQAFDWLLSISLLFILPALAAIFPFFRFWYAPPVHSLKSIYMGGKSTTIRYLYLGVQYIVTFVLIVVSLFFVKQLHAMLHQDVGYTTDNIIRVPFQIYDRKTPTSNEEFHASLDRRKSAYARIEAQMNASPLFTSWEYTGPPHDYTFDQGDGFPFRRPDQTEYQSMAVLPISKKILELFGFKLIEGRLWNDSIDHEGDAKLILNRKAMEVFGVNTLNHAELQPENPIWPRKDTSPYQIIGVIENFYCGHLSNPIVPIAYHMYNGMYSDDVPLVAHIVPGKKQEALAFLDKLHHETVDGTFNYSFATDEIKALYRVDKQITLIYSSFALIAIFISSLGLFGLSLFDIRQRYREIALRKVNGATTKEILPLLLKKYAITMGISFLVATPLSYWGIHVYLEDFAYQATISWWLFALAAVIVSLISFGTLIYQVKNAANINPSIILKGE